MNRRNFIGQTAKGLSAALVAAQLPAILKAQLPAAYIDSPLGFQTFPIRDMFVKDVPGTLKIMKDFGYQLVEMCSPSGYAAIGYGPLVNVKGSEIRRMIEDAGLTCPSCHFGFGELKNNLDDRIDFSHQLGLTQMICSTFWLPKNATLSDYQKAADELNQIGEKTKKAGMQLGFHNHDMEFAKLDGVLIYDALMERFDPQLVKMQFQTEVINQGYKAADYFKKYPGRFISAHLSDWTTDKKQAPIGQGVIDWKEFYTTAQTGGVQNYFVEMDFNTFKDSAAYIRGLQLA